MLDPDEAIVYNAEPTAARLHASTAFVRGLMGPLGSGKSSACVVELIARASRQAPHRGVRRTRWAIIRSTYPMLKSTTIKTFQEWLPDAQAPLKLDIPITCRWRGLMPDDTWVDAEFIFLALDREADIDKLKSMELTGAWINEAGDDRVPQGILKMLTGRVGRFPPERWGGPTWSGIIMDTNPPSDEHWYYRLAEEERPRGYVFFRQPPALIEMADGSYVPNTGQGAGVRPAENIRHLPGGFDYYLRQIPGKDKEWIKIFIRGDYGVLVEGRPVYSQYRDEVHYAGRELEVYEGLPLWLGWDFGRTPACVFAQLSSRGQLRVIDELFVKDMGIRAFAEQVVRPHLANEYPNMAVISVGDPAGSYGVETDEITCMMILDELGLPTFPARTNALTPRIEAVELFLKGTVDIRENEPSFVLSSRCKGLRRGFLGAYHFQRVQVGGGERYRDTPAKNDASHPHDGLQYVAMEIERVGLSGLRPQKREVKTANAMGWT